MQIFITKTAEKGYHKSPQYIKQGVKEAYKKLFNNPLVGTPLAGELKGKRRIRIGTYRLVYSFKKESREIYITAIEPRGGVYK